MKPQRQHTRSKRDRFAGWAILLLAAATIAVLSVATLALARTNQPASPAPTVVGLPPQLQLAVDNLSMAVKLDPTRREAYTALATAYRLANRREDAAAVWRMAAQANPQEAWPWLALALQLEQQGDFEGQLMALVQAEAIDDDDPALQAQITDLQQVVESQRSARAAAGAATLPSEQPLSFTPLAETLSNDWTLVGMLTSRTALRADENARAWFFWQAPFAGEAAGSPAQGWEQIDGRVWVQKTASTHNLVTGGDFERNAPLGEPLGFPQDIFNADPGARRLQTVLRDGLPTTVATLQNDAGNVNTSFTSAPISLKPGTVVLYSGLVRSTGGGGALGYRWFKDGKDGPTQYLLSGEDSGIWEQVDGLLEPPEGTAGVITLLMNNNAIGNASFDDIIVLALEAPAQDDRPL